MKNKLKTLAGDTIIYGFSSIFGRFLSFILTPIYTNYLETPQYDFVIYSFSIVAFLNVIYAFGMESAYFRFFSFDNKLDSKKAFTNSYLFNNGLALIITIFLVFMSGNFGSAIASSGIKDAGYLFILAMLMPFIDSLTYVPFAHLRMSRQAKKFAITKFVTILVTVILNFLFLTILDLQAEGVFVAQIIGSSIAFVYFIPLIKDNLFSNIDWSLFKRMMKFGIPTIPASISAIILQVADRPILKELTNSDLAITTYQVNYRLGIPMMIFVTVFEYAFKPFYLSIFHETDAKVTFSRVLTYFTLLSAIVFLVFSFFIGYFVQIPFVGGSLINPKYWGGLNIVPIVLLAYFFNGLFINFTAGFIIEKKTSFLPIAVGVAAIVNIAANFLMIPSMGYTGAAWATLIAYLLSASILYYKSRQIYPIDYEWGRVGIIIFTAGVIFFFDKWMIFDLQIHFQILLKLMYLLIYGILLRVFGFFNTEEIVFFKNFIKFKKK